MKERIELPQGTLDLFDPTDAGARTAAWLGHFRTGATDVERCAADSAGLALSGAASAGAPRMDQSSLGHVGQQPARQILSTHQERVSTTCHGKRFVAKIDSRRGPGAGPCLGV